VSELIFTVGEALAVFLAHDPGPLAGATRFDRLVAGAEVNVAAGLVQEGHRARVVSRVGDDPLGDAVEHQIARWGLGACISRDAARPTGTLIRTIGGADRGEAVHLRVGAAAEALTPADVDEAWTDDVAAVFVTGITMVRSDSAAAAVERAVVLARRVGALVVVDPNVRPALADRASFRVALRPLRGRIDIAVGDPDELALLAGTGEQDAVATLLGSGCRMVVTKLGAAGAMATAATGQSSRVPAYVSAGELVDTIGAGDGFTAGFLAGILDGESVESALERGALRAAAVVRTRGDVAISEVMR
jgi:sugar/nucleoside kinase (ribokinase family)